MNKIITPFVYRLDTANVIKDNTLLFNYNIIYPNVEVYHNSDVHLWEGLASLIEDLGISLKECAADG